jgi:hypothetical protein
MQGSKMHRGDARRAQTKEFLLKESPNSVKSKIESFPVCAKFSVAHGYSRQGFARAKTPSTPSDGQGLSSRANARGSKKDFSLRSK